MDATTWTLPELVSEAAGRLAQLPAPKNGQVRAVPDERTIRYYSTIGLLDRPLAMRGRTALYGPRHLAQVVAIKRLQGTGKTLAEIQAVWPTLDDVALARMSGVALTGKPRAGRSQFWKRDFAAASPAQAPLPAHAPLAVQGLTSQASLTAQAPAASRAAHDSSPGGAAGAPVVGWVRPAATAIALPDAVGGAPVAAAVEVRIELAPGVALSIAVADGISLGSADIRALRASATKLVEELATRGLVTHPARPEEEP